MDTINKQNINQDSGQPISGPGSDDISVENTFSNTIEISKLSENPSSIYRYFVASPMYVGFSDSGSPERVNFLQDFNRLSPNLRSYLVSADTVETIFSIGKEAGLDDGNISALSQTIRNLLLGKVFIKDFPSTISKTLEIDDAKAGEIANKLISRSFVPILEDIKRTQRIKFADKVSAIQKESRPGERASVTQPSAAPITPRQSLTPGQKLTQQQTPPQQAPSSFNRPSNLVRPPNPVPLPRPAVPPIGQLPNRPPQPQASRPQVESIQRPQPGPSSVRPRPLGGASPERSAPLSQTLSPELPQKPPPSQQPQPLPKPAPSANLPSSAIPGQTGLKPTPPPSMETQGNIPKTDPSETKKSLEDDLAKIANIIDLRSNQPEK